jgi:predicted nucleic acid-binding protein
MTTLCIDTNIVVGFITGRAKYVELWEPWLENSTRFIAPTLIYYEITNVLHRYLIAGELSEDQVTEYLQDSFSLGIVHYRDETLHQRAAFFARQFTLPAAYDAHYLALSERFNVDFWTADKRLARAVLDRLPWVKLFSE